MLRRVRVLVLSVCALAVTLVATDPAQAQHRPESPHAPGPGHGTPPGWKFTLPKGDPVKGREAFAKFECYACHAVRGEKFPAPTEKGKLGPELSAMAPLHEIDYFAESILNPGRLIEKGRGYEAPDGSSKMPSYNDSMTVQELIDLAVYIKSLAPPAGAPRPRAGH